MTPRHQPQRKQVPSSAPTHHHAPLYPAFTPFSPPAYLSRLQSMPPMTFDTLTSLGQEQPLSLPRALSFDNMYTRTAAQNNLVGLPACTVQLSSGHMPRSISMYSNCGLPLLGGHTAASSPAADYGVHHALAQQSHSSSGCLTDMQISPSLSTGHVQTPVPTASASLAQAMLFESQHRSGRFPDLGGMPAATMLQAPAARTSRSAHGFATRAPSLPAASACLAAQAFDAANVPAASASVVAHGARSRIPRQSLQGPAAALQYDAAGLQLDSKAWGEMPPQGCQEAAAALRHEAASMQLDSKAWAHELVAGMQPASVLSSPHHSASLVVAHRTGRSHAADTAARLAASYAEQSTVLKSSTGMDAAQVGMGSAHMSIEAAQTAGHMAAEKMVATQ